MNDRSRAQLPTSVLMVRPAHFGFNPETANTNLFQHDTTELSRSEIRHRAKKEFDLMSRRLSQAGVEVVIVEDRDVPVAPDAVFPNNWISFHDDGTVVLYPMCSPLRRLERRKDVIQMLEGKGYRVSRILDLTGYELEGGYLEGTGSIVFDHVERCAYANISPRTDAHVLQELCETLGYSRITFRALDRNSNEIYHTNVMMSIGDGFAVVCVDSIRDPIERKLVVESLEATRREIVTITYDQLDRFCGNILHIQSSTGPVIAMSTEACLALTSAQRAALEKFGRIVESPIPLIEGIEGGSARCMLAGVHLPHTPKAGILH